MKRYDCSFHRLRLGYLVLHNAFTYRHCLIDSALILCAAVVRLTLGKRAALNMITASLVIILVVYDFIALISPSVLWPNGLSGIVIMVLMVDLASLLYAAGLLYSIHGEERVMRDIQRLKQSKYINAPA